MAGSRALVVVVLAAGCQNVLGLKSPGTGDAPIGDGTIADVTIDGSVKVCSNGYDLANTDAIDGFPVCAFPPAMSATIDMPIVTGPVPSGLCQINTIAGIGSVCLVNAQHVTVPAGPAVAVTGTNVLVILADTVDIIGTLSVTANFNQACTAQNGGQGNVEGGAGGAGGAFGGSGGNGGDGQAGLTSGGIGAAGIALPTIRGGCRGGNGGEVNGTNGLGGDSGGAVWIIARDHVSISGAVVANGSGGRGGGQFSGSVNCAGGPCGGGGGGGGGSGGYVRIAAATGISISGSGFVAANGAGGGEGGDRSNVGAIGVNGCQLGLCNPVVNAPGGAGSTGGGNGGTGGSLSPATNGYLALVGGGGGGGGGGAGFVVFRTVPGGLVMTGNAEVSPFPK